MNYSLPTGNGKGVIPAVQLVSHPGASTLKQIMRITVVFAVLIFASLQFLLASPVLGQNEIITLELKNETLESALKKIEKQTTLRFVYRNEEVKAVTNLTLEKGQRTVEETLSILLRNTTLTFKLMKKNILIVKADHGRVEPATPALPDHTVEGQVKDETGEPLAGVSIVLKGTTIGTTTDAQGAYRLTLPDASGVLQFSFIGYATQEVAVGNQTTINISLSPDVTSLSEIVVTALGISREERSIGYATQEVKGETLTFTKEQNVLGSLSGKVAGVQVIGSSGASMGGTQKIKIRGVNTLTGSDQPLIVLDGTPMANMNFASETRGQDYGNTIQDINPDDIESVNVLKGPAASALYGLRGQNGVIMITTKKGAKGPKAVTVEYNGAYSVEKAGNFMPTQNIYGGGSTQVFGTLNDGTPYSSNSVDESWGPKMDGTPVRQFYSWFPADPDYGQLTPFLPHPDNIKDYYELGNTFNNTIAISGGAENSTFRLSYNHTDIKGVEPNTWLKRNNVAFNGSLDLNPKLKLATSLNYANNSGQRPAQGYIEGTSQGASGLNQWFQRSVDMKKLKNYKYPDGTFLHWNIRNPTGAGTINTNALYWANPYFGAYENISQDNRDRFFGNVALSYEIIKGLKVTGTARSDMFTQNIDKRTARGGVEVNDGYWLGKYQNKESNYELLGEFNKEFGDLSLNAILGGNIMDQKYTYLYQETVGGLISPGFYSIEASIARPIARNYRREKQIRSMYGMVSLGFRNIWFVDASIRNDNSSALPVNNNSYWYPSVSASMVFSELVNWQPMSMGKLRLSYAVAGGDLAPYSTSVDYQIGAVYPGTTTVNSLYFPSTLNNPDLKPSFSKSYEGGLDLKFLENRVGVGFTLYQQQNENQILTLPVSGASGYSTAYINAGLIENKGYEIALTAVPVQRGRFSWEMNFNISKNKSMVKELYNDGTTEINNYQIASNTYSGVTVSLNARVNEPYGTLIGQNTKRDPATGKLLLDGNNLPTYEANHNFGSVLPDFTGGFQNTFTYGPLSLNAMIDFQAGGQFFSWSRMMSFKTGLAPETAALNANGKNVRDPLAEGGGVLVEGISEATGEPVSAYVDAKAYFRSRLGTHLYDQWLYDASFVRLREVRLGYTFSKKALGNLPVNKINVGLIARNPMMLWQKAPEGLNPAELAKGSESINWLETGQLITVRSYGVSLNVTF
ncbi:MAG TPA: SusC/RagA family TonB-linked outer membrane protein [Chryseosolibacter sp.]